MAYDVAVHDFRSVVVFCDEPPPAENDGPNALVAHTREVCCAFAPDKKYVLSLPADDIEVQVRMVPKGTVVHAVLAWDSTQCLSIFAFMPVEEPSGPFEKFFSREIELQKASFDTGPSFRPEKDATPLRLLSAAETANVTSPPAWKSRKVLPEQ